MSYIDTYQHSPTYLISPSTWGRFPTPDPMRVGYLFIGYDMANNDAKGDLTGRSVMLFGSQKVCDFLSMQMTANRGDRVAQYALGNYFKMGYGVAPSNEDAVNCYKKAAEQGNPDAQVALGCAFRDAAGIERSYICAEAYFRNAALQENVEGQYCLGMCYYQGQGVSQDYKEAVFWFKKAADQGHPKAKSHLDHCNELGLGVVPAMQDVELWIEDDKKPAKCCHIL